MMIACKHARQQTLSTIAVDKPTSIEGKCHEQPEVVLTGAMSRKWRRSDAD